MPAGCRGRAAAGSLGRRSGSWAPALLPAAAGGRKEQQQAALVELQPQPLGSELRLDRGWPGRAHRERREAAARGRGRARRCNPLAHPSIAARNRRCLGRRSSGGKPWRRGRRDEVEVRRARLNQPRRSATGCAARVLYRRPRTPTPAAGGCSLQCAGAPARARPCGRARQQVSCHNWVHAGIQTARTDSLGAHGWR